MTNTISITGYHLRSIFRYVSNVLCEYIYIYILYRVNVNSIDKGQYTEGSSFLRDGELR